MKRQIYISGTLTHGERKKFYEALGKAIDDAGLVGYVPHIHNDELEKQKPGGFYRVDKQMVQSSAYVLAYVGAPSLGVGSELEMAVQADVPIIMIWQKGDKVSKFTKEMPGVVAQFEFENEEDAVKWVSDYVKSL